MSSQHQSMNIFNYYYINYMILLKIIPQVFMQSPIPRPIPVLYIVRLAYWISSLSFIENHYHSTIKSSLNTLCTNDAKLKTCGDDCRPREKMKEPK
uniref:Ovule protein n=1 Tax=Heterorhabditis bacteriophora TaxID=37862 RepID=A0A1I7WZW1_HETBA